MYSCLVCHFPDKQIFDGCGMDDEKIFYFTSFASPFYVLYSQQKEIPFSFCFIGTYESIVPVIQFFNINSEWKIIKKLPLTIFIASISFHSLITSFPFCVE